MEALLPEPDGDIIPDGKVVVRGRDPRVERLGQKVMMSVGKPGQEKVRERLKPGDKED